MLSDSQSAGRESLLVDGLEFVDPRGTMVSPTVLAPQPKSLAGASLGLLDNSKWNAARLLEAIGSEIEHSVPLRGIKKYRKETWGQPAAAPFLDQIAGECDAVITASGD